MAKLMLRNFKFLLVIGFLCFVLVSQANGEAKQQQQAKVAKQRRGITEWRFKRMNQAANAIHPTENSNQAQKLGEYDFYLSLLPKETGENSELNMKPLVFKLDLVSESESTENYNFSAED